MLQWQEVEHRFFYFFEAVAMIEDRNVAGAIYYASESFGGKLKLVDNVMRIVSEGDHLKIWLQLMAELSALSGSRNILAHLQIATNFKGQSFAWTLEPPMFKPAKKGKAQRSVYDRNWIESLAGTFNQAAVRLGELADQFGADIPRLFPRKGMTQLAKKR